MLDLLRSPEQSQPSHCCGGWWSGPVATDCQHCLHHTRYAVRQLSGVVWCCQALSGVVNDCLTTSLWNWLPLLASFQPSWGWALPALHRVARARAPTHACLLAVMSENGFRMKLTITDTPGFGDQVDNSDWYGHASVAAPSPICSLVQQLSLLVTAYLRSSDWPPT